MIKVLFVCLGNICRSPLGEGMFRHLVTQRGLEDLNRRVGEERAEQLRADGGVEHDLGLLGPRELGDELVVAQVQMEAALGRFQPAGYRTTRKPQPVFVCEQAQQRGQMGWR